MKEKGYNPFKMWGSYVGAGIGLCLTILAVIFQNHPTLYWIAFLGMQVCKDLLCIPIIIVSYFVVYTIGCFLIGWGVHSLVRRLLR